MPAANPSALAIDDKEVSRRLARVYARLIALAERHRAEQANAEASQVVPNLLQEKGGSDDPA